MLGLRDEGPEVAVGAETLLRDGGLERCRDVNAARNVLARALRAVGLRGVLLHPGMLNQG